MRTGIYAYNTTTLTIQASESFDLIPFDSSIPIFRNLASPVKLEVQPGIYKVVTDTPITVTGGGIDVVVANNKDPWPDPPALVITTFNVTSSTLDAFFTIADGKSMAI